MTDPRDFALADLLQDADWLAGLARRLSVDQASADDLVQETISVAMTRPPRFVTHMRGWLTSVAHSLAAKRRNQATARQRREASVAPHEATQATDRIFEKLTTQREVVDAILELPRPYAAVILARYYEDLKPAAIAERSGESLTTVKSRLARGLEMLRERLVRRFGGEDLLRAALAPITFTRSLAASGGSTAAVFAWSAIAIAGVLGVWLVIRLANDGSVPDALDTSSRIVAPIEDTGARRAPEEGKATPTTGENAPMAAVKDEGAPERADSQIATSEPTAPSIDGRHVVAIVDADGKPAAGVPVSIVRRDFFRRTGEERLIADAGGRVVLDDVIASILSRNAPEAAYLEPAFPTAARSLREIDLSTTEQDWHLTLPETGSVDVEIVDGASMPIAGTVKLTCLGSTKSGATDDSSYSGSASAVTTVRGGRTRIDRVGLGLHLRLRAELEDGSRDVVTLHVVGPTATSRRVSARIAFGALLPKTTGRIVRDDGTPMAATRLRARIAAPRGASDRREFTTDADGGFSVFGVFRDSSGAPRTVTLTPIDESEMAGFALEVDAASVPPLGEPLVIRAGRTLLSGRVCDAAGLAVAGASVQVQLAVADAKKPKSPAMMKAQASIRATTDAMGRFEILGPESMKDLDLRIFHDAHPDISLRVPASTEEREFEFSPSATVRLRALVARRIDNSTVAVSAVNSKGDSPFGSTFSRLGATGDGTIYLRKLLPGEYRLQVGTMSSPLLASKTFVVDAAQLGSEIDLGEFDLRGKLDGGEFTFVDENGSLIGNQKVSIAANSEQGSFDFMMTTDEWGRISLPGPRPTHAKATVSVPGYALTGIDPRTPIQTIVMRRAIKLSLRNIELGDREPRKWMIGLMPVDPAATGQRKPIFPPSMTMKLSDAAPSAWVDAPGRYDVYLFPAATLMGGEELTPCATIDVGAHDADNVFDLDLTNGVRFSR